MPSLTLRSLVALASASLLLASGPASAHGFGGGHGFGGSHASMGTQALMRPSIAGQTFTSPLISARPVASGGGGVSAAPPFGAMSTAQGSGSGRGMGHHHGKPPSGGSTSSSSESSSSAGALIQQTPATTTTTPVTADMTRNPALTGGTDPAIGQSSPPVPDVFASGGGTAAVDHSGGGANTLASCMGFWDSATHMSKSEWRDTCERTLNGIDLPADGGESLLTSTHAHVRHMRTKSPAK